MENYFDSTFKDVSNEIKTACKALLDSEKGSLRVVYSDHRIVVSGSYASIPISLNIDIYTPPIIIHIECKAKNVLTVDAYVNGAQAFGNDDKVTFSLQCRKQSAMPFLR